MVGLTSILSGCLNRISLKNNEYLLYNQSIRGNKAIPSTDLETLIPQKPNRRILRLPITFGLWFYQIGSNNYNRDAVQRELDAKIKEYEQQSEQLANNEKALNKLTKKNTRQIQRLRRKVEEGNWVMRVLGEPPAYFQVTDVQNNTQKMRSYLVQHGFFLAKTSYRVDTLLGRRVRVNYLVEENIPFHLRNITYRIADPTVDSLVRQSLSKSLLKSGDRYSADNITNERIRIEELLRNQGYYAFSRQFIPVPLDADADTSRTVQKDSLPRPIDLWVNIVNPPGQKRHPVYQIGDVEVRIGRTTSRRTTLEVDTVDLNGIRFYLGQGRYSTRLLDSRIFLRPNSLYRISDFRETQRQLFLLNQFKFTNVNFTDTLNYRLRTIITAAPIDKYEISAESGLFVLYQGSGTVPGPFGNLTFRVRNMSGGLETFETSVRFGIEAQTGFIRPTPNSPSFYSAQEFGLNTSLTFPHILFPGRTRFTLNRYNPRTQFSLGYNFTGRPDYTRRLFRGTMSYSWLKEPTKQFTLSIADINYLRADIKRNEVGAAFQDFLDEQDSLGSTIKQSFLNSFASSVGFAYTYNTNIIGQNRRANFLRIALESGGTTLNLTSNRQITEWTDKTGLQLYKYLRANVDFRHYVPVRRRSTLAFRLNTGFLYGYGPNQTAPYEKRFFAGGSNSIRAWLPRRLGPGSALPRTKGINTLEPEMNPRRPEQFAYNFEQPGDILLEGSAELRGHLLHLGADIDGAVFIDAGNVWTRRDENSNRIGEEFRPNNFLSQIAVGTGVGLRFDFSFFIIRFDGAVKAYDPARRYISPITNELVDERFFLPKFRFDRMFKGANPLVINFGIGYPF